MYMHMHLLRLNGRNKIMDCGVSKVGHGFGINGHLGTMEMIKTTYGRAGIGGFMVVRKLVNHTMIDKF